MSRASASSSTDEELWPRRNCTEKRLETLTKYKEAKGSKGRRKRYGRWSLRRRRGMV